MSSAITERAIFSVTQLGHGDDTLARRRGQKTGHVKRKGPSWLLQWREYVKDAEGKDNPIQRARVIAPAEGPDRVSRREAERIAREEHLSKIDQRNLNPGSMVSVADFAKSKFEPMVMWKKKPAGQKHYGYLLEKHILPVLGSRRLCDVSIEDVEALILQKHDEGYSSQTILHVKNGVSAMFRLAKRLKMYRDENPALDVEVPEVKPKKRATFNPGQLARVIVNLKPVVQLMARMSIETSMNVAELCGLRIKLLNLTAGVMHVDGEVLAPYSVAVRENYYEGEYGSLKKGARCRNLPITQELAADLAALLRGSFSQDPDAPVFQSRRGTPIDAHNISNRHFAPLSKRLGFSVTWHAFRRAHSTMAGLTGVPLEDRSATMGHADRTMSLHYSVEDVERRRMVPIGIMQLLTGETKGGIQ